MDQRHLSNVGWVLFVHRGRSRCAAGILIYLASVICIDNIIIIIIIIADIGTSW